MKIFVNNVDGFLAGALCADLYKISHHIVGTRKGRQDDLVPPMVKRIVPRVEVRRLLKAIAACDVVIYDLHDADLEELELVLRALQISEIHHRMTFILVSSVGVWARTQRGYEEIPIVQAESNPGGDEAEVEGEGEGGEVAEAAPEAEAGEGEGEAAGGSAADTAAAVPDAPTQLRPVALRSEDYTRRVPAPKFQEWKAIETQVLSLKEKATIRPYVVCAGVPYGNGEDAFLGLFKAAWQTRDSLRVIGEGNNYIPMVHARDAARLVRHVIEVGPTLDYHLAVDRGDCTQKALITSVAKQYNLAYEPQAVTVVEALLAELADILTMDLRLEPSALMQVEMPEPSPATEGEAEGEAGAGYPAEAEAHGLAGEEAKPPEGEGDEEEEKEEEEQPDVNVLPPFRWWSEKGIVANLTQVSAEFTRWRRLQPVRICVTGPPGSGVSKVSQELAELYHVPAVQLEELVEEQRNLETPLGQQVREQLEAIQANLGNPKSQGPFVLTAALTSQLLDHALATKSGVHRGYVIGGFPQTLEEATSTLIEEPVAEEPPPDKKDKKDKKDKAAEEAPPEEPPMVKEAYKLDMAVLLSSSDEGCLARAQASEEKPYVEKEFQVAMERWKKDAEAFPGFFEKMSTAVCRVSADSAAEAVQQKYEEAVKAAAEEEKDPPEAPDPADLLALATGSYAWVKDALMQGTACLEGRRPVFNFKPSQAAITAEIAMKPQSAQVTGVDENAASEAAAAAAAAKEAEKRAEKARQEQQRVEQVKKEELARLEKHSEPLRLYLMKFVVPALTGALVDVCREQPDDPAGYLAEYLQVYSEVAKQRERERGLETERVAAAAASADSKQG
eukprot:TRINITY_DN27902_c0_g2_i1.p1 TRINITY_DN27902_c0_g2~~TRINITY_DN27902_c0_g2_i1.p1  ORF type:complete len:851 (-),score=245.49 TRINITY_DN27902_c0_g2_i1:71-2602(-)